MTLATADLQEGIRAAREKRRAGVHRAGERHGVGRRERPPARRHDTCLPLASVVRAAGASSAAPTLGAAGRPGQRDRRVTPVDKPVDKPVDEPSDPVEKRARAGRAVDDRPAASPAPPLTSDNGLSTGCGREESRAVVAQIERRRGVRRRPGRRAAPDRVPARARPRGHLQGQGVPRARPRRSCRCPPTRSPRGPRPAP